MGLDLAGFQHQRLELALADNHIKAEGMGDHLGDLIVVGHPFAEILADPGAQPLGLANVDDRVGFIPDDINTRQKRQHTGLLIQFLFGHRQSPLSAVSMHTAAKKIKAGKNTGLYF